MLTLPKTSFHPILVATSLIVILFGSKTLSAQANSSQDDGLDPGQAQIFRQMGLDPTPFNSEQLGLTINLPETASLRVRQLGDRIAYVVGDAPQPLVWQMQIESVSLNSDVPLDGKWADAGAFLNQILVTKTNYEVMNRLSPGYAGLKGQLCYIKSTPPQGEEVINGWLVLPNGRTTLLVITISMIPEVYDDIHTLLERSFSTIKLKTEEQRNLEQRARISQGRDFLNSITPERIRALVGQQQWFRTYRPASEDGSVPDQEIACSVVEIREALRGELNANKAIEDFSKIEKEEGIIVRIQGRIVVDVSRNLYFDTVAQFWMSWDQSSEAWSIIGTHRQGRASRTDSETGIRTAPSVGNPIPRLTVIRNEPTPYEWDVPNVYLSQPLAWMLGQLLPRETQETRFFTYYFYNARGISPNINLRYDRWEPLQDGSGWWQLATMLDKNQPPDISLYSQEGKLIRRRRPNGDVTEPMSRKSILRRWRNKGLQTGSSSR
ncbi:MAG: hypothetical protein O7G85_09485 [Planctomycetota bacterium]|nr:hypothetical protein [Planctomycetota bacterium]